MSVPVESLPADACVDGSLRYLVPSAAKPATYIKAPGAGASDRSGEFRYHTMPIRDGRPLRAGLSLDGEGFELRAHRTVVSDFFDDAEVERVHYPEAEALIKAATRAARVLVFDHTVRSGEERVRTERHVREPVQQVHNDYTEKSGPQRVRDLLPDEADDLLARRFAFINIWRPLQTVRSFPLAACDAQSIAPSDLVATDLVYADRVGEVYNVAHSPEHRWYYFPAMESDEVLLLKCYDSARDGRARFTAHTAFDDPTSPPDAPPRQSIELRTIAFF